MIAWVDSRIPTGIQNAARFHTSHIFVHQDVVNPLERGTEPGLFRGAREAVTCYIVRPTSRRRVDERIVESALENAVGRRPRPRVEVAEQYSWDSRGLGRNALQYQSGGRLSAMLFLVVEMCVIDRINLALARAGHPSVDPRARAQDLATTIVDSWHARRLAEPERSRLDDRNPFLQKEDRK